MSFQIKAQLPSTIEFAFDQTSIPLFGFLEVVNEGHESREDLVLELSSDLSFCERKIWEIKSLAAQSTLPLDDTEVALESRFFLKLPERTAVEVRLRLMKGEEVLASHSQSVTLIPPQPRLSLICDHSINYAFQQNSIPVVKELRLQNNGVARRDLLLRLTTEPAFAPTVDIRLQAIESGGEFRMSPPDLKLKLSHDFLAELNEKVVGWLKLEMIEREEIVQSIAEPISLLAHNEWCGLVALPEILAAFVLPNDPAVMTILGRASELLKEAKGRSSLNAYQDKSRKRAWEQVAAIYKAIGELEIRYIVAPASFETTGQKVRFPSEILSQRFGNCLDLSLLFAACCEQAGLRPFVFIHDEHAYAGCWLEERSLREPASDDLQQVRKLATDELITVFEAITVTTGQPGTLIDGELVAKPHLGKDDTFGLALDIHAARSARIHPLPVPGQAPAQDGPAGRIERDTSSAGLGDREFTDEITITDAAPPSPASRVDLWKSRLLDLSLRNRLLNFRETKSTIRILAEPEHVEDELAAERELSLRPKPKMMSEDDPRNAEVYTREQRADALKDHLRDELRMGRIHTHLEESEHARRLTELFRSARNALEENGTNTLFAAVGILEWRETEQSDRIHRAPLLLMPVELKRKSVLEGFSLRRIDEETRLNVTLMEMLRQNFRKDIPGLEPLPEDESGVDVPRVLRIFRDAVRELSGWEVKSEVWLGQFSFTKFLLWKDLTDRLEDLTKNRVVRHLIHEAGSVIAASHVPESFVQNGPPIPDISEGLDIRLTTSPTARKHFDLRSRLDGYGESSLLALSAALGAAFVGFGPEPSNEKRQREYEALMSTHLVHVRFDPKIQRRYAGDYTLPRGRYYALCDEHGNDQGTLIGELRAYYEPERVGVVLMFDCTLPDDPEKVRGNVSNPKQLVFKFPPINGTANPFIKTFSDLIGKPNFWDELGLLQFSVGLPLTVRKLRRERVLDLREPSTGKWLARTLSTLEWRPDDIPIRCFPGRPPLEQLVDLLPELLVQENGGGGANMAVGVLLRHLGADGLIFPSARNDAAVFIEGGKVVGHHGWNFVDYADTPPAEFFAWIEQGKQWPMQIGFRPNVDAPADEMPVWCPDVTLASHPDGSWQVQGLRRRTNLEWRKKLLHYALDSSRSELSELAWGTLYVLPELFAKHGEIDFAGQVSKLVFEAVLGLDEAGQGLAALREHFMGIEDYRQSFGEVLEKVHQSSRERWKTVKSLHIIWQGETD